MKRLTITYGDETRYDDIPGKLTWVESSAGVFEMRIEPDRPGFLEQFMAKQQQQQEVVQAKVEPIALTSGAAE